VSSINRKSHCLNREKTVTIPRKIIFVDTEAHCEEQPNGDNKQYLRLGWGAFYQPRHGRHKERTDWFYFQNAAEFWAFVESHTTAKTKLWVIAHNMNYDFTILHGWRYLKLMTYKLKFFHNSGTTTIISVRKKGGSIVFLDSMNWFPESLEKCGQRLKIPKVDVDFNNCTDEALSKHCKRDVEILLAVIKDFIQFLKDHHISRLCYTRASVAMAAYLLNYYDHKIYIHNNQEAVDLERASYRGGRTECFYLGELVDGPYNILDVNSLYPSIMVDNPYPVKYEKILKESTPSELSALLENYSCISTVFVNTPEPVYAVKQARTIFPVGRFWVTLCTPELKYALENNHVLSVGRTVVYKQARIFKRFINRVYALRQDFKTAGNESYDVLCKYILNSLYGKFGQKADIWKKIGKAPNEPDRVEVVYYPEQNKRGMLRYLLGEVWKLEGYEEAFNSFPAISSHVTAYGRMYLYDLMKVAGQGNYYYCDTDSLIVNTEGLCNLKSRLNNIKLGALKVQEVTASLNIKGLKDYITDAKTVIKGVRRNAVEIESGVYKQELWPSIKGMLREPNPDFYTVKTVTKTLRREYTKGIVTESGWIVPFDFESLL